MKACRQYRKLFQISGGKNHYKLPEAANAETNRELPSEKDLVEVPQLPALGHNLSVSGDRLRWKGISISLTTVIAPPNPRIVGGGDPARTSSIVEFRPPPSRLKSNMVPMFTSGPCAQKKRTLTAYTCGIRFLFASFFRVAPAACSR
jgi:hypothetical protein